VSRGRPSSFTQAVADALVERMIGGESVRQICRDANMPGEKTVYQWLAKDEIFAQQYARGRVAQMEAMGEDIIEISDAPAREPVDVQRNRLRVDSRKWLMSKLAPKKYGDKLELSGDAEQPVEIVVRYAK
jgi:hypothetical protein